jgi:hypothetical protein
VALFAAGATCGHHQPVVAPHSIVPGAMGDVGPQAWPVMTMGHVEASPFPSGVRSLTLGLSFYVYGGWRQYGPLAGLAPPSEGDHAPSGSGKTKLSFLGSGEARPIPKVSDERNLRLRGRANRNLS